jgi:hypothetical protein
MPGGYPHCFPVCGPESVQAILESSGWPKAYAGHNHPDEVFSRQKLQDAVSAAKTYAQEGCGHCGSMEDLWACQDHDGFPCVLCKGCHDANHRHPLTGDHEPDIDEIVGDCSAFNHAMEKDD